MRHGTGFFVLAISLAANYAAAAERFSYPPTISLEEVRQWIDKAPVTHPRSLPAARNAAAKGHSYGDGSEGHLKANSVAFGGLALYFDALAP